MQGEAIVVRIDAKKVGFLWRGVQPIAPELSETAPPAVYGIYGCGHPPYATYVPTTPVSALPELVSASTYSGTPEELRATRKPMKSERYNGSIQ
jgi:hypothetical protein